MPDLISFLTVCWYIVEICLGVGFVIFVHELGHFAVAKFCGVKCEKFYLGFDIGGWKLCKFRWGETEYGIGILPLGGYVKMLGQEDNPTKLKEEIERAKLEPPTSKTSEDQSTAGKTPAATDFDVAAAEKALYDPRSYLAKSVPKRMAIISAGVIMNVIFGFILAVIAYSMGVSQPVCTIGDALPGEAGWRAGLRPGDRILEVAGQKVARFKELQKNVAVGDISNGVSMVIERPSEKKPLEIVVHPDRIREIPSIGITSAGSTKIVNADVNELPYVPDSAASKAKPAIEFEDRITGINGEKIDSFGQLQAFLVKNPEKTLRFALDRTVPGEGGKHSTVKQVEVVVPPQLVKTLGLVMGMGAISAVQNDSPAAAAGIRAGDKILKIDGSPVGDPMKLPDVLRRRTGETIVLTISRKENANPLEIPIKLREAAWMEHALVENSPVSVPQLGIAYHVLNEVAQVQAGSPAEKAGIRPGTKIKSAVLQEKKNDSKKKLLELDFDKKNNWAVLFSALQTDNRHLRVVLTSTDDKTYELSPIDAADWFDPDRGFLLEPDAIFFKAKGIGEAVRWGAEETWESLTMVVKILHGVGSQQISIKAFGGPGTIFYAAYLSAKRGIPTLLLFLTMLSANLAVLNVLPIPMLDGGHLVFLTYEGIRGKPADERVQVVLSVIGLVLLLALMVFVVGLDVQRFWPK